jgi:hypothetical protein
VKEYIIELLSCQCKAIFGAIMNFLDFWSYAFIISKKISLPLFELIKDKAAMKVWYVCKSSYPQEVWNIKKKLFPKGHMLKFAY